MQQASRLLNPQPTAGALVDRLLGLSLDRAVCLLDSGGAAQPESHLLIAGVDPVETREIRDEPAAATLRLLDEKLARENLFGIFTIAYDFGLKLENIVPRRKESPADDEPDVFLALFDALVVHDYATGETRLVGNRARFDELETTLAGAAPFAAAPSAARPRVVSNFTKAEYLAAIEEIRERIRRGDTYQTNLTQQLRAALPAGAAPQAIFQRLRAAHPAAFSAFLKRAASCVVSASPERFFRVAAPRGKNRSATIEAAPIKGTRPRGATAEADARLRRELLESAKDRAENVMIVDLLRNDLGRLCAFGSVRVERLCALETHPTLHHLVSTIRGELRAGVRFSELLRAVFPCGSITGAPKISTMRIIDELETAGRGLSMGAIGCSFNHPLLPGFNRFDLSVAIRTMVVRGGEAVFNVGGGIVIDSRPEDEYAETLVKAQALLNALDADFSTR